MDEHGQLGVVSTLIAASVLTAMWVFKDVVLATVALPSSSRERLRLWWLRCRGLEDYKGRHRA